ncbi:hypothetical protein CA223_04405 [Sphingomonas koreensis]|jgi:hypothetical protein|uniref:Uncharacterized protein n=2 Tax=Sphingomonas koreensis TaxID=93064 RepID=A0A1L6JBC1_9SPHN|nr:hypothetical protein [Sphingomonas koreensis]APR53176.1 hypothetical protein BRX40_12750 [Sphingomonas koreensis]RSU24697.1 hypothetical protein CA224_03075 [Sphingomonas koreensis]RSU27033.1 hypothetical protein CA222_08375 [Sphingomonas koreensis]RSU32868.1 hypothetical protein BRX39_14205 [Sphingomonas koreensis]RSU40733.1 hypothetical protein BRX38_10680 [Sphingomonas koreensis]
MDGLEPFAFRALRMDPDFPLADVEEIADRLVASGALVPGYVPPEAGLLSVAAFKFTQTFDGTQTILLPDRNLISRMARIARDGAPPKIDAPTRIAIDLMAFAQAVELDIEPSIAFHELAHRDGNALAHDELSWFRAANHGQAQAWIDIAQARAERLPITTPAVREEKDLAFPLHRWNRNYIVALKTAELELSRSTPLERARALLQWMAEDFFLAGPAAIFATMYFSPFAGKRRLFKQLRSKDRERAIAGIRNAAWDMTHLSQFVAQQKRSNGENIFFLFATADRGLAEIAPILMIDADETEYADMLAQRLSGWWPPRDAVVIANDWFSRRYAAEMSGAPPPAFEAATIRGLIDTGERTMRSWKQPGG